MSALASDDSRHGTVNGYRNLGCRCDRCRDAHRMSIAALRRRLADTTTCPTCGGGGGPHHTYEPQQCHTCYAYQTRTSRRRDPDNLYPDGHRGGRPSKLPDVDTLYDLHCDGLRYGHIADRYGVTPARVRQVLGPVLAEMRETRLAALHEQQQRENARGAA